MAKTLALSLLTIFALLSNSNNNCVSAILASGGSKVVRIDLEKKYLTHHDDNLQLSFIQDINLIIDGPDVKIQDEIMLESDTDEMNYS